MYSSKSLTLAKIILPSISTFIKIYFAFTKIICLCKLDQCAQDLFFHQPELLTPGKSSAMTRLTPTRIRFVLIKIIKTGQNCCAHDINFYQDLFLLIRIIGIYQNYCTTRLISIKIIHDIYQNCFAN